ncbi:hypothetical protein [Aminobacter sp. BE322]|uniref:hypothetical protein n=1 Tax=unclassified Aminobacter TaxID=2644704 RepID=UPI003D2295E6
MRSIKLIAIAAALSACTTQQADVEESRFASFKGMSIAQFMAETLVTPSDYYEASGFRVFVADKRAPDARFGCTIHLETKANGKGQGPEGWTIVRTRRQGGCAQV